MTEYAEFCWSHNGRVWHYVAEAHSLVIWTVCGLAFQGSYSAKFPADQPRPPWLTACKRCTNEVTA